MPQSVVQVAAALLMLHAALAAPAAAQATAARRGAAVLASPTASTRSTVARLRTSAVRIDGILDSAEWSTSDVVSDFLQAAPQPGEAATQHSSARVLYDDEALYVALRMDDSAADSIIAPLARRDFNGYSDWAHVIIDSYQDRRTAFRFGLNPAGVKRDAYISGDNEFSEDLGWDAVWDGAARRDAAGWSAEFRIPLSQLRFDASRGEAAWGIQFARDLARRAERSTWTLTTPALGGFVSRFGTLLGVTPPRRTRRAEIMPFTLGSVTRTPLQAGNPFTAHDRVARSVGVDLRVGVTNDLTLSASILPDFGQVEADPGLVNLSGIEVAFAERRPFFVEGGDLFQQDISTQGWIAGRDQLFYSRRIGRAPQGSLPAQAAFGERIDATRVLGALKLSGKTRDGWSIGALSALTEETRASFVDGDGTASQGVIEPMSHYGVLRLARDLSGGEGTVGLFATSTHRRLDGTPFTSLRSGALVGGVTLRRRFARARWQVEGAFVGSEVRGTPAAITATQRSIARLYQRPDAQHLSVDSTATSLSGLSANLSVAKTAGGAFRFGIGSSLKTPGFEANDLGLMARADMIHSGTWMGYESVQQTPRTRARSAWFNAWYQTSTAGENTLRGLRFFGRTQFQNFRALATEVGVDGSALSTHVLRGGPALLLPTRLSLFLRYTSDQRRRASLNVGHFYLRARGSEGYVHSLSPDVTLRPSPRTEVTLGAQLSRNRLPWQFVGNARSSDGTTRSVIGDLRQRQVSLTSRVNVAFTPNVSLQFYAQPFAAAGHVATFSEVVAPRAASWRQRVRRYDAGEVTRLADGKVTLGAGTSAVTVTDPSFGRAQFRGNAVLRWEYRPSSTLFVVWSQARDHDGDPLQQDLGQHGQGLLGNAGTNVLTVKWTHWIGR